MSIVEKIKAELMKTLGVVEETFNVQPELKVSDMVIGGKVEVVNEDGTLSDAPDGEYKIGEDVVVVKDSIIVSINGQVAEEVIVENTETKEEVVVVNAEMEALKAEVDGLKNSFAEVRTMLENMLKQVEVDAEKEAAFATQLQELTNTIKALAVTPAEFSKTNNHNKVKDSKEQKMSELFKAFSGVK